MKKINTKLNLKQRMDKIKNLLGKIEKIGFGTTTLTIHHVPILQLDKTWKINREFEGNSDRPFLTAHEEGQDAGYPRITLFGNIKQEGKRLMQMMTLKELKNMKPDTIFASGIGLIEHPWFNNAKPVAEGGTLEHDGKSTKVKWVATRGFIGDWAIYHSMDANLTQADYFDNPEHLSASNESIARGGAKLHDEEIIKKFVPCDDEAFKMYRH